jgi:hypothetical protein
MFARIALLIVLPLVFGFCIFGFLSTFEPSPAPMQLTWRTIYAVAGLGCLVGVALILGKTKSTSPADTSQK